MARWKAILLCLLLFGCVLLTAYIESEEVYDDRNYYNMHSVR